MMIEVRGLTKGYGETAALRGIELDIAGGELFGLVGPAGAGKSTVLRILGALAEPSGGRAWVAGCDVVADRAAVRREVRLVTAERESAAYLAELGRALRDAPRVLLLDEPAAGLDPADRSVVWSAIEWLRIEAGLSIVVATRDVAEVECCDRIALLDAGRIMQTLPRGCSTSQSPDGPLD